MPYLFCALIASFILLVLFFWALACDRICKRLSSKNHQRMQQP